MNERNMIIIADESYSNRIMVHQALVDKFDLCEPLSYKHFFRELTENTDSVCLVILSDTSKMFNIQTIMDDEDLKGIIENIPLMIISSNITDTNIQKSLENSIFDYIVRPFNKELLVNRINNIIKLSLIAKNTKKSHSLNIQREQNVLKQEISNSFGTITFDLRMGTIKSFEGEIKNIVGDLDDIRKFQIALLNLISDQKDKNKLTDKLGIDNIKQVVMKESSSIYDVFKIYYEGKRHYISILIKGYDDPETHTICGICVLFDKTQEVLNNKIYSLLYKNHYELTAIINTSSAVCSCKTLKHDESFSKETTISYDELITYINEYVKSNDPEFNEKFKLSNIKDYLKTNNYFELITSYKDEDINRYKSIKCQYIDESNGEILLCIEDISYKFITDSLTGSNNYQGFIINGKKIINKMNDILTVVYCSVSSYKRINELLGSEGGRVLLEEVHDLLNKSKLKPMCIGRNNDSYLMIVKKSSVNEKLLKSLNAYQFNYSSKQFNTNLKFGLIDILSQDNDLNSLCDKASLAESEIRNDIFRCFNYYNTTLSKNYLNSSKVIDNIDDYISKGYMIAVYQPIINTKTAKVELAEALVRFKHPKYGVISPDSFVPILEDNGLVYKIDKTVIECVKSLKDRFEETRDIDISVNISRADFYVEELTNLIKKTLTDPSKLYNNINYEVTESFDLNLSVENSNLITWIQDHGAKILLDDFGYKYSTFNTLLDAKFDIIKIYSGLTNQIGKNNLAENAIKSIIMMAHASKMKVIAEGIETKEQYEFYKENNCDYIQGFFFSKPLEEDKFIEYIKTHK